VHTVYLGLGSNLGDRQGNILQALQKLRVAIAVEVVSAYYEAPPALGAEGPAFLNVAVRARTELEPVALETFLRGVELAVGRQGTRPLSARPIDIDILLIDDLCAAFGRFEVPHPSLAERPFNLVPLAEIAAEIVEPRSGERIGVLAAHVDAGNLKRLARSLHFFANRQEEPPDVALSIDRVGVANVKRSVRLHDAAGRERAFNGEFTMVADLRADKAGLHMSRFSELLEEATLDVLSDNDGPARIEDVVRAIAQRIVASQRASRADVRLRAQFGLERWTPVSGKRGEETYTLVAIAHAGSRGTRHVIGVEAEGMTACPCAQSMVREHSMRELLAAGFTQDDAARALDALPVATHNQRGRGSVLLGTPDGRDGVLADDLVEIVENSMSSETYDLLKRPDEFFIVNKAHRNPRFVEDVVRGILARTLDMYAEFPDDAFVAASQVNYESIHKHDALAEAFGTFGELRRELRSGSHRPGERTDLPMWLGTRASQVTSPNANLG